MIAKTASTVSAATWFATSQDERPNPLPAWLGGTPPADEGEGVLITGGTSAFMVDVLAIVLWMEETMLAVSGLRRMA